MEKATLVGRDIEKEERIAAYAFIIYLQQVLQ
jgi:hypothetical protein